MIREKERARQASGKPESLLPREPIAPPELTHMLPPESLTLRERAAAFVRFYWFLGVLLLAFLLFGVLLLLATYQQSEAPAFQDLQPEALSDIRPEEPPIEAVDLSVSAFPYGATVLLDMDSVGIAPTSTISVKPGLYLLSLRLSDYQPVDTLVNLSGQASRRFFFQLEPLGEASQEVAASSPAEPSARTARTGAASQPREGSRANRASTQPNESAERPQPVPGSLTLTTDPPGAITLLNGRSIGRTPVTETNLAPGSYEVTFSAPGYETITRTFIVRENEAASHGTRLVVSEGTLSVLVRPWGSIYVDGVLQKRDTDVQHRMSLPVGRHVVKVTHPSLGEIAQEVAVVRGTETRLVLEFPSN